MQNYHHFIQFPVSHHQFLKIKQLHLNFSLYERLKKIYVTRNFSQVSLTHPYIQIESCLFIHFFKLLKDRQNTFTRDETALYTFIQNQFSLLAFAELIFHEIDSEQIKNSRKDNSLKQLQSILEITVHKMFKRDNKSPIDMNLLCEDLKKELAIVFGDKSFDAALQFFTSLMENKLNENIVNFDIFRAWNEHEFPHDYQPLGKQIAQLLSNIAIYEHSEDFEQLFEQQSCFQNVFSWFREQVITESTFLLRERVLLPSNEPNTKIGEDEDEIEMAETAKLLS